MKAANAGRALALCFVDELVRCGMRHACLSPGSRSTPMALALAERREITLHVSIDERSACFMALGIAKESRRPVAMLTTSGTAAANCLPAVVEADHSAVPLVVITADRPPELRDTGAGQTIDQIKIFGEFVRWFSEVGVAEARSGSVAYWRSLAARAFHTAANGHPGPVHLNVAFRDPLVDLPDDSGFAFALEGRAGGRPWREAAAARPQPPEKVVEELAARIGSAQRGMIIAGTGDYPAGPVVGLAEATGWPLIAEATSNARFGNNVISAYDAIIRSADFAAANCPDLVLIAGSPGLSRALGALLEAPVEQIRIDPYRRWHDPGRGGRLFVEADPGSLCEELAKRVAGPQDSQWIKGWLQAEAKARRVIDALLDGLDEPAEPRIARDVARLLPEGARLAVASSMPVRDLDWFMTPREGLHVMANRGANGIDGMVSTVLGIAAASGPVTCGLLGDLALLYDQNGLMPPGAEGIDAVFVVINNDGGGIFSFLPQAQGTPDFERLFGTPHGRDFEKLAALHGCGYRRLTGARELGPALEEAARNGGVQIIEARTDRSANAQLHQRIWEEVGGALH